MSTVTNDMVAMLPLFLQKESTSNNYKLLDLVGGQIDELNRSSIYAARSRSIDEASGKILDEIGKQYGVTRLTTDDSFYRFLIKSHIEMSLRVGTANEIINVLSNTSGLPLSSFNVENGEELLSVRVTDIPAALTPNEDQRELVISWIKSILPAGIRLEGVSFKEASASEIAIGAVIEQAAFFSSPVVTMKIPGV